MNTAVCQHQHQRHESETDAEQTVNLVAKNKDSGLQQYLNCKAHYNSIVKPDKKLRKSTQEIVHQRVKQMQNKYHQVFRNQDTEHRETQSRKAGGSKKSDEHFYRTETRNNTKTSLDWNHSAKNGTGTDVTLNERDRRQKQLRNSIGNQYLRDLRRNGSKGDVNRTQILNSPQNISY